MRFFYDTVFEQGCVSEESWKGKSDDLWHGWNWEECNTFVYNM